ncbi:MAG TPA: hypothetical protein ACFYEF_09765 [Candidatus Wunengus sp. YC63]|uniref:hypothetical protein n=1 Tax=Candidatus Wunengus sp. YC63 TaxID=3367699 RepID=UPI0040283CE8
MRSLTFSVLAITIIVLNSFLVSLQAKKITQRNSEAIPTIKHVYEKEGIVEILIPSGYKGKTDSGSKGKVFFIDDYDESESVIADIEVLDEKPSAEGKIVKGRVMSKSATIPITKDINFVRFLNIEEQRQHPMEMKDFETILNKIAVAADLCELNWIKSEDIQRFIQNYQMNKNVSALNNRLDERREKLRKEDASRFETVKKDIDHSAQEEKVREIVRKFSETYPCSERLSELDRYAESRIEAIARMIAEKRDNSGEIKGVLNDIDEAIRQGNGEAFCRFLTKENDGFYSRERKIIEEFVKEIQIYNSSFEDVNITIDGNTASIQCVWSMNFTWNTFPEKKFENKSMISLKLKRTNNGWKIFDAGSTNL